MMWEFINSGIYGHLSIFIVILVVFFIFSDIHMASFIASGLYLFILWMTIEFFFVISADNFWHYFLHLTLASFIAFLVYLSPMLLFRNYGIGLRNEGAPLVAMTPPMIYLYFSVVTIIIRGLIELWRLLFG